MRLTWKDPSDGGLEHEVVPVSPSDLANFHWFRSKLRERLIFLSLNSLKVDGQYATTQEMRKIIEDYEQLDK